MEYLAVKNWTKFQRFKGKRPPWIRNYLSLNHDPTFMSLHPYAQALLQWVWRETAEAGHWIARSTIETPRRYLSEHHRGTYKALSRHHLRHLTSLINEGFLVVCVGREWPSGSGSGSGSDTEKKETPSLVRTAAPPGHVRVRKSTRGPNYSERFERFWSGIAYKVGKAEAAKEFANAVKDPTAPADDELVRRYNRYVQRRRAKDPGATPVHTCRWIKYRRWEDEEGTRPATVAPTSTEVEDAKRKYAEEMRRKGLA